MLSTVIAAILMPNYGKDNRVSPVILVIGYTVAVFGFAMSTAAVKEQLLQLIGNSHSNVDGAKEYSSGIPLDNLAPLAIYEKHL